ncbi:MAG: hypothetical protein IJN48_01810 [Clostridia bacterium]|nr:hypothetical protein [Clostridia bacterium]
MIDNLNFSSKEEIQRFVNECENRYLSDVKTACNLAASGGRIITLCGPTCSGKTTTALILDDAFKKLGKELHTISIDDFYYDRSFLEARSREKGIPLDYDSPSTIDLELFAKVVEDIDDGGRVTLPRFDFKEGKRIGFEEITVTDGDVFLFEGIQAVYPELTKYLAGHDYTSLFISVEDNLSCFGEEFEKSTLRFFRRLVRDARTRGATAEFTFSLWKSVIDNEVKNIYSNLGGIDFCINSLMEYEISVIKPYVLPLLRSIPFESGHWQEAQTLAKKLENIPVIDSEFVPRDSVFREFIGKKDNP